MFKNLIFLLSSHSLFALTTLHVSVSSDNDPGGFGEVNDLRYWLNTMNQDLNTTPDDYAIIFDFPMTIQLNGNLPIINNSSNPVNITVGNSGSIPTVTIDGNSGAYGGLFIPTGSVTIQNMTFQNLTAKGGDGGNGTSGGGGGMGAGGAIYMPQAFLNSSTPSVTLMNVAIQDCSAVGGNGGSYFTIASPTGDEGGGGGGGFSGNGGSVTVTGSTGGAGGGGFGGDGGNVTLSTSDARGGGGGGGGGLGSRATIGTITNLGTGGQDQASGLSGNGYGLSAAGSGGGGYTGGSNAGGGGGGAAMTIGAPVGGGGGGCVGGANGQQALGSTPPGGSAAPSGGFGTDGGGGGGGGVVITSIMNSIDGQAGSGGYAGGGGGGAGTGASDTAYTVRGGTGGLGGGGGGGGANQSGTTPADGGDSFGGGGGGGGGPSNGSTSLGGSDTGALGAGSGGMGANTLGSGFGGGGGGGGSGLGGAIFVDSNLNLTLQAFTGIPTTFNTPNNTTQAGTHGTGGPGGATDGFDGSALGNSIFLRSGSALTLLANDANDLLTLGDQVSFVDDTSFGAGGTSVFVKGNGTVIYEGTSDYHGTITINNANFKVNGQIDQASILVCRNSSFSAQRGTLSGSGILGGSVSVNSGTISPDTGSMLTLGSLSLLSAAGGSLGSLVHIEINSSGTSLVAVTGAASLAGNLEISLDSSAVPGLYTVLTSSGITGTFDSILFTGTTPDYLLSYLPIGTPTFVQFQFLGFPSPISIPSLSTQSLQGNNLRVANYLNLLAPDANSLGLTNQFDLLNSLPFPQYENALTSISPSRNSTSAFAAQNVMFMFSESLGSHFTQRRLAYNQSKNNYAQQTAFLADNELVTVNKSPRQIMYTPPKNTSSQFWTMGFGQFSHQSSREETPSFSFNSGGLFAAYDYGATEQGCIGALAGYSHSSVQQNHSMGNSRINGGYLSVYGTRTFSNFFIDAAILGEYMGVDQKRRISYPGFDETAKSSYHAEQLDLHFGTGYDFNIKSGTIEPFGLLDWVFEWDPSYTETGAAPYDMKVASRTSRMFRLETGLNGYKTNTYCWGLFIAQAKLSYVYKKPQRVGIDAAIVNAPTSFAVEAFTVQQSLFSPAIELFWQTNWNGYGAISYDGEFGSGYSSNQFYGKIGYSF